MSFCETSKNIGALLLKKIKILRIGKFRGHEWNTSCIFYNGIGQEWWTFDLLSLTNIHKVTYL